MTFFNAWNHFCAVRATQGMSPQEIAAYTALLQEFNAAAKGQQIPDSIVLSTAKLMSLFEVGTDKSARKIRDRLADLDLVVFNVKQGRGARVTIALQSAKNSVGNTVQACTDFSDKNSVGNSVGNTVQACTEFHLLYNNLDIDIDVVDAPARVREDRKKIHTLTPSPPEKIDYGELLQSVLAENEKIYSYCRDYRFDDEATFRDCIRQVIADWRVASTPHHDRADAYDHLFRAARGKYIAIINEKNKNANNIATTPEQRRQAYATLAHQLLSDPRGEKLH